MSYLEEIKDFRHKAIMMAPDFLDVNGRMIKIGDFVHYVKDARTEDFPTSPWTPDRWGIVIGLMHTVTAGETTCTVRVHRATVWTGTGDWASSNDEFYTQPGSLEVI